MCGGIFCAYHIFFNFVVGMKYSRKSIDRAGKMLLDPFTRKEAMEMVSNWRSTHLPVLREFVEELTNYLVGKGISYAFYSQRVKRMTSIIDKLRNNKNMGLGGLQDIGGARFVFDDMDSLQQCKEALETFAPAGFTFVRTTDYITAPKVSGYRSIHYIYQYSSDKQDYDGLKIELQIRTRLQHSWAMAVETASLISRSSLKANIEDGNIWREFFKLVSAIFAIKEECTTPIAFADYTHNNYCKEYRAYLEGHKLYDQLSALRVTVNSSDMEEDKDGYCVLSIDFNQKKVNYKTFPQEQEETATTVFSSLEQSVDSYEAVLLVSIAKMREIRDAYPSYFLDTREFLLALKEFNDSCDVYKE